MAWRVEWESREVHVCGANSTCIGANKRHRKGLTAHRSTQWLPLSSKFQSHDRRSKITLNPTDAHLMGHFSDIKPFVDDQRALSNQW
jgi:hypothetical protein